MSQSGSNVGPGFSSRPKNLRGRAQKYPWDQWLDGKRKQLRPGIDFAPDKPLESMRSQILLKAASRDLRVTTEVKGGYIVLDFIGERLTVNWDEIFDGEVHQLVSGVDFDITVPPYELIAAGFKEAHARGIQIKAGADVGVVAFRAILPESASQPEEVS